MLEEVSWTDIVMSKLLLFLFSGSGYLVIWVLAFGNIDFANPLRRTV